MSDTTVDTRQVSIHFDHADFEQGVAQTLQSLNKLNQAVESSGNVSSSGFQNLSDQLSTVEKEVNKGILPAMESMTKKFSIFGTVTDQITRNVTNSLMNLATRITTALFQVKSGMDEYELKMGSIQTILAGTGESLETVNKHLEELNDYSDKTIYTFKDMTDNIGKFTNQGVALNDATNAMKGISNEAALAGANAQQASRAMYNFSQALSSGYVKLIDWRSIELAMMATSEFRNVLIQTGEALGTVVKNGDKYVSTTRDARGATSDLFDAQQGFRESLASQWLTKDVLIQALELYATDVRALSDAEKEEYETKLKSKGFTEEQIKYFEELGIRATDAATQIKTFSMLVQTAMEAIGTGWARTFELIFGDFEEAKALWTNFNKKVIDPLISRFSDLRNNMIEVWRDKGGRNLLLQSFVNILNAIISISKPLGEAFRDVFGTMDGDKLYQLTEQFAKFTESLVLTDEKMESLREKAESLFKVLKFLYDVISPYFKQIAALYILFKIGSSLNVLLSGGLGLGSIFTILKMIIGLGIVSELLGINQGIEYIYESLSKTSGFLSKIFSFFSSIKDIVVYIFSGIFTTLYGFISSNLHKVIGFILKELPEDFDVKDVIDLIGRKIIYGMMQVIKTIPKINWLQVLNVASLIAGAVQMYDLYKNIKATLGNFNKVLGTFFGMFNIFNRKASELNNGPIQQMTTVGKYLTNFTNSLNGFAKSLQRMALAEMIKGVAFLVIAFSLLIHTIANSDPAAIVGATVALAGIMGMILLFNKQLIKMSENISPKGLIALFLLFITFSGIIVLMTAQFMIFGTAVVVLTAILGDFGKVALALLIPLGLMAAYFVAALVGIHLLSVSLQALGKALPDIAKGALALITMSVSLLAFGLALAPLVIMGLAVTAVLTLVIAILTALPADKVIAAIGEMTLALLVFTGVIALLVAISKMINIINILGLSIMLISFAASVAILAASMLLLQNVNIGAMVAFFASFLVVVSVLTVVFANFGLAALTAIPLLIAMTVHVIAFGAAFAIASLGLAALSLALSVLVTAITGLIPVIQSLLLFIIGIGDKSLEIVAVSVAFAALGKSLIGLSIGMGLAAIASLTLGVGLLALGVGFSAVSSGITKLGQGIALVADGISHGIYKVIATLQYGFTWGMDLIGNFAEGMTKGLSTIKEIALTIAEVISAFLHHSTPDEGPLKDDDKWGFECIVNFVKGLLKGTPLLGKAAETDAGAVKEGFTEGVEGTGDVAVSNILSELKNRLGEFFETGASSASEFFSGFNSKAEAEAKKNDPLSRAREKMANGQHEHLSNEELEALYAERWRKKKEGFLSYEDFLGNDTGGIKEQIEEAVEESTNTNPPESNANADNKGASTVSDSELKKQAEAQKNHNKYVALANKLAGEYATTYEDLMKAMGDTNPQGTATAAIEMLKDHMYQASITADMTEEELTEAAQNVEKQFVESYENIKNKTSELFDGFKEFNNGFSSMTPAKTILKNVEDQVSGVEDMENLWRVLALRSGTNQDYLANLMAGGAEKLPELRSLVSMNNDEYSKYMAAINDRESISERVANTYMITQAFALQRDEIIKTARAQKAYKSTGKKMIDAWNDAYNSGANNAHELCNSIAKDFDNLAKQNGLTFEQLRDQVTSTTLTTEEELEKQINAYTNLASTVEQWKSTYMKSYEDVKNGLSGLSTDLSDFDLGDEKSGKHLYNNLAKRNKALGEWGRMLNDLASRGLNEAFLSNLAGQGLSSYQDVKALHSLDTDRLRQMNGMMQSIEQQSEAIAKKYGASIANKMVEGVDENLVEAFKKYAITDKVDLNGLATELGINLQYIGNQFSLGLATGIEEKSGEVKTQVETIGTTVDTTASTYINTENGYDKTNNWMKGMINGINANKDELFKSVDDVSTTVAKIPYDKWEEGSPSRLTWNYAKWFVEGMTRGFAEYGYTAWAAAEEMVSPIAGNIKNALAAAYNALTGDGSFTPTITPVVNLSAAQNGIKTLGTMREISPLISSQSNIQVETPNRTRGVVDAINSNRYDDSKLINEVAGLRNDVNTLNDKMGNLQVVMDSGPLVGAIAPKMDTELGTIYRRRNRG